MIITDDGSIISVDILWRSNGTEVERMDNVFPSTMDNLLVYTHSYTISQLNTNDDGRVIQCEANITEITSMFYTVTDNITLDVTGENYAYVHTYYYVILYFCSFILHSSYS